MKDHQRYALTNLALGLMMLAAALLLILTSCTATAPPSSSGQDAGLSTRQGRVQFSPGAPNNHSRVRPVRPPESPQIVRTSEYFCQVMGTRAILYDQGGITRPITNPFPCPDVGKAREMWGNGTRMITLYYRDGTTREIVETWP